MRKITAGFFMSLDGVVSSPKEWRLPVDAETGKIMGAGLADADAILLGRRTYLEFTDYWSGVGDDVPMAKFLNSTTKYVASTTLTSADWANSVLIKGDLETRLREIRSGPGKNIQVPGSPRLVWWLLGADLLDELNVIIQPVVVGKGDRLPELSDRVDLVRAESTALGNGVVSMTYRPATS